MVNLNPYDPGSGPPGGQPLEPSRPQYRELDEAAWQPAVFGGIAAILVILGVVWATAPDTPNQQSAQNQPRAEGPANTSPSPPAIQAPSPSSP
jgi:hypothetical protein